MNQTDLRVLAALRSGPLYEGALTLIVPEHSRATLAALKRLELEGKVKRDLPDNPLTWKLADSTKGLT